MFVKQNLSFKNSKVLNPLVQDYIENKETISSLFDTPPSKIGFKNLLSTNPYSNFDRKLLSGILLDQSKLVSNTTQETLNNISLLNQKKHILLPRAINYVYLLAQCILLIKF